VLVAYQLSKSCRAIIRQNIVISLGVLLLLALSSLGFALPLPLGVLFHEGSTVIVVLNSLRLLFIRK
jgi:Cd2+/Zn2+-exporting ATPase